MTVFLVDRSTGQIRTLALFDYLRVIQDTLDAGYFVVWSRSAAETQQRAVWQGIAKVFVDEIVEIV